MCGRLWKLSGQAGPKGAMVDGLWKPSGQAGLKGALVDGICESPGRLGTQEVVIRNCIPEELAKVEKGEKNYSYPTGGPRET